MRVYFEAPTGALLPLTVAPESSVQETRRRIGDRLKLPPEAVDLTFGGGKLQDDALLSGNGIRSGSTIGVHLLQKNLREDVWNGWRPASLVDSLWNTCGCSHENIRCEADPPVVAGGLCFPAGSPAARRRAYMRNDLAEGGIHQRVRYSSREPCRDSPERVNSGTLLLVTDAELIGDREQPLLLESLFMKHMKRTSPVRRSASVGRTPVLRTRMHHRGPCIWSKAVATC